MRAIASGISSYVHTEVMISSRVLKWMIVCTFLAGSLLWAYVLFAEPDFSVESVMKLCANGENKALCYTKSIRLVLARSGVPAALDLVAGLYIKDPAFKDSCHSNTHELGKAAYHIFKTTGHVDLTTKASYCGFGFYHGFMEQMFTESGDYSGAVSFCHYVGTVLGGDQAYAEGSCYHGIGHGVTDASDPRVWGDVDKMLEPGLALCRDIAKKDEWLKRCASGVFNAIVILYRDPRYRLDAHNDPYALCAESRFNVQEKHACYSQMNTLASHLAKGDIQTMFGFVRRVQEPLYMNEAMQNAAGTVYSAHPSHTFPQMIAACQTLSDPLKEFCIRGMLSGIIEFAEPGAEADIGLSFCNLTMLSREERSICFDQLMIHAQGIFSPAQQRILCGRISHDMRPRQCAA